MSLLLLYDRTDQQTPQNVSLSSVAGNASAHGPVPSPRLVVGPLAADALAIRPTPNPTIEVAPSVPTASAAVATPALPSLSVEIPLFGHPLAERVYMEQGFVADAETLAEMFPELAGSP